MNTILRALIPATLGVALAVLSPEPARAQMTSGGVTWKPAGSDTGSGSSRSRTTTKAPAASPDAKKATDAQAPAAGSAGGALEKPTAPAPQPGGDKPALTPKSPGAGAPRAARPTAPRSPTVAAQFNMTADSDNLLLRLTPEKELYSQDIDVLEGDDFVTDVLLTNPKSRPYDRVRIILGYNPAYLTPLSLNDSALRSLLSGDPVARVDRNLGRIIYEAVLKSPVRDLEGPLVFINWRALKPVIYTPIEFTRTREEDFSEVFSGTDPMLGEPSDDRDGTVSIGIMVIPANPEEAALMREEPSLYMGSTDRVGGVQLRIDPPAEPPRVDEAFDLDIVLDNGIYSQLDGVSMLIRFDPEFIEILDADHDNWITHGYNIEDGPFHADFPFDYHMANQVYPTRGLIEYRVGASKPDQFLGANGVMARIKARALKPTAGTGVYFLFAKRPGTRTTEVVYLGQDVLGDTRIKNDGIQGAFFPIRP